MKKCFVFFLFVFLLVHHKTNAQGFIRAQTFEGITFSSMIKDDSDNFYSVGSFKDSVDVDPSASVQMLHAVGKNNLVIIKQDTAGNLLWAKQIKGRMWAPYNTTITPGIFTSDKAGNLYLTGTMNDSFDFDPGPNGYWIGSPSGVNFSFVLKLNSNGDFVWAKAYQNTSTANVTLTGFAVRDASIYLTAYITGTIDMDPGPDTVNSWPIIAPYAAILEKLDTAGHYQWTEQVNGASFGGEIIMDTNAHILVKASFANTIDVDPGAGVVTLTAGSPSSGFIEMFDSSGNYLWVKSIAHSIWNWKFDKGNNIIMTGSFDNTTDFDLSNPNIHTLYSFKSSMYLLKLTNNGSFSWVKGYHYYYGYNANYGIDFALDSSENIYLLGGINFGSYSTMTYTQKIDSLGNVIWGEGYSQGCEYQEYCKMVGANNILLDHSNKLYTLGGYYGNNVDLDPTSGTNLHTSVSNNGYFIQKLCTDSYPITLTADTTYATQTSPVHLTASYYPGATYVWMLNGKVYNSNGTNTLTTTAGGNYTVNMYGLGCTSVSNIMLHIDSLNAIGDIQNQHQLLIFPNPAKDLITVQYTQGGSLSLMDIAGRQLGVYTLAMGKKSETIDISSLAKGVYLLRFVSNNGAVETVKVVKE